MDEALYQLEIESFDLGSDVRSVGLELINPETREPVTGFAAAAIWAAVVPALTGLEPWALDFFAHVDRVRDFCRAQGIAFYEPNEHALVVAAPPQAAALFERFAGETFGIRAGALVKEGDTAVEGALAARGVDAYQSAFLNYLFCAVCDFENGFLTVLSEGLWASEIIRRARLPLRSLQVEVTRPGAI